MNTTAIANHLNVLETAITRCEEWANCLFVVVKGLGARFVSKKVLAASEPPSKLAYDYPNGQRIEMLYSKNRDAYQVYAGGTYKRMAPVSDVLQQIKAMDKETKAKVNLAIG